MPVNRFTALNIWVFAIDQISYINLINALRYVFGITYLEKDDKSKDGYAQDP